jgi:nitrite reductase (NADH) large subunit
MKEKLVVIGNGMAGARTVEELLRRGGGDRFEITMFGAEPHGNYNRILLSNVLNGSQDAGDIFINPLDWYRHNHILLHAGVRVEAVDREARKVLCENGSETPYDKLIIATGSRPFVPKMAGLHRADTPNSELQNSRSYKPGVFVMRTLDDCAKIAGYAVKCRRAAVIGGGLLGLEAARGLMQYGASVHVVHRSGTLMNQQLDNVAGAMLKESLENMGIGVLLNRDTREILGDDCVEGLSFVDGSTLECDMVVIACGITPNVELARDCGLATQRAIVVDDQLRSSDSNIYVVGECVQHRGVVYGLVAPLWEQARALADVLSKRGPQARYCGSLLATKLKVMGIELASMGEVNGTADDEIVQYSEPKRGRYKKLIIRDGKLIGAILMGEIDQAAALMQTFEHGTALPDERATLLFDIGSKKTGAMLEMPDEAQICNCNGVSKGAIRRSVEAGQSTLIGVMNCTRAGTGCGSCKKLVGEIVDWVNASR